MSSASDIPSCGHGEAEAKPIPAPKAIRITDLNNTQFQRSGVSDLSARVIICLLLQEPEPEDFTF